MVILIARRQKERLIYYCKERDYNSVNIYDKVASGLNDNRRELTKMFGKLHEVHSIVVEYPDRFAILGLNYLKEFSKNNGIELEMQRGENNESDNKCNNNYFTNNYCEK